MQELSVVMITTGPLQIKSLVAWLSHGFYYLLVAIRIAIGSWAPHLFHLSDPPFTTRSYVHLATQAN